VAGYSGKSLLDKLGVKPGLVVYVDRPDVLRTDGLDEFTARLPKQVDISLLFCLDRARLDRRLQPIIDRTTAAGMVWVCWPKKASKVPTDLTEGIVREAGLGAGVVDVKVAAVDDVWSGLKFVRRLADR